MSLLEIQSETLINGVKLEKGDWFGWGNMHEGNFKEARYDAVYAKKENLDKSYKMSCNFNQIVNLIVNNKDSKIFQD